MRTLCTSLGSWDTIEGQRRHGMTFPLAILAATMEEAGLPAPDVYEGEQPPADGCARDYRALLVSMMDSRHMWRLVPWLRRVGVPERAVDRGDADPIVVVGGQAATAPAPITDYADVVYIGEAEAHAAELLHVIARGGPRRQVLEAAAAIPGCWVPRHQPADHVVDKVETADIGISLRHRLSVSLSPNPRLEIARGCKSRCGFCALGWRSTYRENSSEAVADAVAEIAADGIHQLHLSAGDAEGHSRIDAIRAGLAAHDIRDHGWTGRLDTIRDCSVSAGKMFAIGLEGASHRLRRAVGKPRLTEDYVATEVEAYWRAGGRRMLWHLIGGLPGETDADADELDRLLRRVMSVAATIGGSPPTLEVARQPFGPLPHTPMQWFAPGLSTARVGRIVESHVGRDALIVASKAGQSYAQAIINAVVMRGGAEVGPLLAEGPPPLSADEGFARADAYRWLVRRRLTPSRYYGAWDPDAPTSWDFVRMPPGFRRDQQRAAYRRIEAVVAGGSG